MPLGKIVGLVSGVSLAYFLILPHDIFYTLQFTTIPWGDLARLFAGIIITIAAVALGHFIDAL